MNKIVFLLVVLELLARAGFGQDVGRTLRVTGHGRLFVPPEVAYVELSISRQDKRADLAQAEALSAFQELMGTLVGLGIKRSSIKTAFKASKGEFWLVGGKKIAVSQSVSLELDSLPLINALLDSLNARDISQISLGYFLKDPEAAYRRSLLKAVDDATSKARLLAESLHVKLGPVLALAEGGPAQYEIFQYRFGLDEPGLRRSGFDAQHGSASSLTTAALGGNGGPIWSQPKELEVEATVQMMFELQY
jgi:uncharacterized protein YggE